MKKNFRNRLLATLAAGSMSFLLLSGFDSSLTVEEINEKATEAMREMGGMNCEIQGTADLSVDVSAGGETQSLPISGAVNYAVQMTLDPFVMHVSGSMSGDATALGVSGSVEAEVFMAEQEDGTGIMYMRLPQGEDTGWHAASLEKDYMDAMLGSVKAAFSGDPEAAAEGLGIDITGLKEKVYSGAQVSPEAVNVNGVDCYEITQTVDGDTLFSIISQVMDAMPQAGMDSSALSAFQMLFSGIQMDLVTDCSVETCAPVYASVDLAGSDFSMIGQMFGAMIPTTGENAQAPEISVNVNALNMAMNYEEVPSQIEIPAEALAAEVETSLSMADLQNAAQQTG